MKTLKSTKNKKYIEAINQIIKMAGNRTNVCKVLDIKKTTICNWLNMKMVHRPSYENASKIEAIFGIDKKTLRGK